MVLEMAIQVEEPVEARDRKLATGMCKVNEEMARVQLELNLQIVELQLKAQSSTPLEVKDQRASTITIVIPKVNSAMKDYTNLFGESFEFITTL